jgi:hypothetical protein
MPHDPTLLALIFAVTQMFDGDPEGATKWLNQIPRDERGQVKIVLDDLDMALSRLGRGNAS